MNKHSLPDSFFLHELANIAGKASLEHYRTNELTVLENKPKADYRFDPVTQADKLAEKLMREHIEHIYPNHSIMGEEYGITGEGPIQWVLDPIDGTRPFLCGLPLWANLIGLTVDGTATMGMMSQPYIGERFWADETGSWTSNRQGQYRLQTRKNVALEQAILHTTSPEPIENHPNIHFTELTRKVLMTRYGGECYAMAMLAAGRIDVCFEFALEPYDIVPLIPIIEQAGGRVTTLDGNRVEKGGAILATGCPILHEQILHILNHG
ncbi:inositol monophosphatase family protein [Providencia burhodogranariea]|uniref:Histidinol-phosphate phosphatase n=1 Tax=Providencia burhodogranariea DSM 19968 TaxID=1141662 RepID=K8WSV5_9GAMM|nr:inositol monophosphatase family protein [Providencia burhodogranariea]EKT63026.1 histidinol-phosphate phosphatase [Providencia burhodogranariea DSM 19968]